MKISIASNNNLSDSSSQAIIKCIEAKGVDVFVFEPALKVEQLFNSRVISNFTQFKAKPDVIVFNRMTDDISYMANKVFTHDLFGNDEQSTKR